MQDNNEKIESLMRQAIAKIKDIVDTNTVIGNPINCADGTMIIPITKVTIGFIAGGGEYSQNIPPKNAKKEYPFVVEPYHVSFFDVMVCSHGVKLCALTMSRRACNSEFKESCSRYKKYLERKNGPKLHKVWNHETKQLEYGFPVDYNNWNM